MGSWRRLGPPTSQQADVPWPDWGSRQPPPLPAGPPAHRTAERHTQAIGASRLGQLGTCTAWLSCLLGVAGPGRVTTARPTLRHPGAHASNPLLPASVPLSGSCQGHRAKDKEEREGWGPGCQGQGSRQLRTCVGTTLELRFQAPCTCSVVPSDSPTKHKFNEKTMRNFMPMITEQATPSSGPF